MSRRGGAAGLAASVAVILTTTATAGWTDQSACPCGLSLE
jgi:hypothetical protein